MTINQTKAFVLGRLQAKSIAVEEKKSAILSLGTVLHIDDIVQLLEQILETPPGTRLMPPPS